MRETALGPEHPDIAVSLNNLAALYREQGRYSEALSASTRAVEIAAKHLSVRSSQRSETNEAEQRALRFISQITS
jgi:hypothetical protein